MSGTTEFSFQASSYLLIATGLFLAVSKSGNISADFQVIAIQVLLAALTFVSYLTFFLFLFKDFKSAAKKWSDYFVPICGLFLLVIIAVHFCEYFYLILGGEKLLLVCVPLIIFGVIGSILIPITNCIQNWIQRK